MFRASRKLWFRLLHNKMSTKVNTAHALLLPDINCPFCGRQEMIVHILFAYPVQVEVWLNLSFPVFPYI
jgi:hypothetical protein